MEIGIYYFPDEMDNLKYLNLLKHEMIHIKLHYLCRKNIKPIITSKRIIKKNEEWFKCVCDMVFIYNLITITIFFRILISSILSMIYDLIYYIINQTFFLMRSTIINHILIILHYLFKMMKKI